MRALAPKKNSRESVRFAEAKFGFGTLRWMTAILVGPVVCSFWAISQDATILLLVPTLAYLLLLACLYKKSTPPRCLSKAKVPTILADTTACAICSKSNKPMYSFSYRTVTNTASVDSLGLLSLVVAKQWTSHEKHSSAFCMVCSAKAVLMEALLLVFWLSCAALLAFSFARAGVFIQASIVITGAAVISPLRHHLLGVVKPVELCRFLALEVIDKNKGGAHSGFEIMSENYWGSLENGLEPVESDEELVTCIQLKLVAYTLVAAILTSQLSVLD